MRLANPPPLPNKRKTQPLHSFSASIPLGFVAMVRRASNVTYECPPRLQNSEAFHLKNK